MIVLLPGYVEPAKIYELRTQRDGNLTLTLKETVSGATMQDLMENHLEDLTHDKIQTILCESASPEVVDILQRNGYHVIAGRL